MAVSRPGIKNDSLSQILFSHEENSGVAGAHFRGPAIGQHTSGLHFPEETAVGRTRACQTGRSIAAAGPHQPRQGMLTACGLEGYEAWRQRRPKDRRQGRPGNEHLAKQHARSNRTPPSRRCRHRNSVQRQATRGGLHRRWGRPRVSHQTWSRQRPRCLDIRAALRWPAPPCQQTENLTMNSMHRCQRWPRRPNTAYVGDAARAAGHNEN